jgi:hypothetical protein
VVEHLDELMETVNVDGNYYKARVEQLEQMPDDVRAARREAARADAGSRHAGARLAKVQLAVQELGTIVRDIAAKQQRQVQMKRDISRIPPGYDPARTRRSDRRGRAPHSDGSRGGALSGDARA